MLVNIGKRTAQLWSMFSDFRWPTCRTFYLRCLAHVYRGFLFVFTVSRNRYIPEQKAVFFFRQIISGIDYLHKNSITHRDIKPANIILDAKQQVPKLIDFGFTNIFDEVTYFHIYKHPPSPARLSLVYRGNYIYICHITTKSLSTCAFGTPFTSHYRMKKCNRFWALHILRLRNY